MGTTKPIYISNNQLTKQAWQMGNTAYAQEYTYNSGDGSLDTMTTGTGSTLTMGYDALRRLSTVNAGVYTKTYHYRDISSTRTTTQISSLEYSVNDEQTYSYTYDDLGNIATYTRGETTYTYSYDNQNQLLSATDGTKTYTYTYDTAGNILATDDGTTEHNYTYGDSNWRDLLTAFDGESITYDTSGNPLSYYNGTEWTFTWQNGRELATAINDTNNISYTYDLNGVRTSKTVDGVVHNYIYASGKLLRETYGNNVLDFFYDSNGTPFALKYNGTLYYYITNLQGDVMNLVDANGTVVATYDYDPFGNVIGLSGTMATTNPLRYRGYYYDSESSMYYLQSRYYDPTIGRFINADGYASTGQGIIGSNMFAYCLNNPVNRIDATGVASLWYYLIVDHDMGFVHRMVLLHIRMNNPNIATELVLTGLGRADVVDPSIGVVWEVKHAGNDPAVRIAEALLQAVGYIGGKQQETTIYGLGEAYRFSGTFFVSVLGTIYQVDYNTPVEGVVLYSVNEVQFRDEESTVFVYIPKTKKSENKAKAFATIGFCAMGLGGGSFSGFGNKENLYNALVHGG